MVMFYNTILVSHTCHDEVMKIDTDQEITGSNVLLHKYFTTTIVKRL